MMRVVIEPYQSGWNATLIDVPEGPVVYGRSLTEVRRAVTKALVARELAPAFEEELRLPPAMRAAQARFARAQARYEAAVAREQASLAAAARALRDGKVSLRDSGEILGLSAEAVRQVLKAS